MYTCRACGKKFRRITSFDAHRTGPYYLYHSIGSVLTRRCLSSEEMIDKGFSVRKGVCWSRTTSKRDIEYFQEQKRKKESQKV